MHSSMFLLQMHASSEVVPQYFPIYFSFFVALHHLVVFTLTLVSALHLPVVALALLAEESIKCRFMCEYVIRSSSFVLGVHLLQRKGPFNMMTQNSSCSGRQYSLPPIYNILLMQCYSVPAARSAQ